MLYENYVASNREKLNKQNVYVLYLIVIIIKYLFFNFNKVANFSTSHNFNFSILDTLR